VNKPNDTEQGKSMTGFETLSKAIERGDAESVADFLNVHPDEVRRWRPEPESGEQPTATGRRSPLDRGCDLITAVFITNPEGAELIVEHFRSHLEQLQLRQGRKTTLTAAEIETSLSHAKHEIERALDSLRAKQGSR
jgi:hypothetical protein